MRPGLFGYVLGVEQRFEAQYPVSPLSLGAIRGEVRAIAEECGLTGSEVHDVILAVSEAAANAVLHGAQGDDPCVRVSVWVGQGEFEVVVCDEGGGMRPRTDSAGAGLGLPVIASLVKRLDIRSDGGGTDVHMTFPCPNALAA